MIEFYAYVRERVNGNKRRIIESARKTHLRAPERRCTDAESTLKKEITYIKYSFLTVKECDFIYR